MNICQVLRDTNEGEKNQQFVSFYNLTLQTNFMETFTASVYIGHKTSHNISRKVPINKIQPNLRESPNLTIKI